MIKRGNILLFLILVGINFIGIVGAAQNPNYPGTYQCGGADWDIGAPDGGSCKASVDLDLCGNYPEVLIGNICSDLRAYPDLVSVNKICQLYTGESSSYATYGRVHRYCSCSGECKRAKYSGGSWSCVASYSGETNIQFLRCGKNCCTPKTCSQLGKNCGSVGNGCGGTLNCGTCVKGNQCTNNVCQCTPATCASVGKTCGTWANGCGGTINCGGTCPGVCVSGNIAQGKSVTTIPVGKNSPLLITDGLFDSWWSAERSDDSSATINLGGTFDISKYSISCVGINGGNTGIVHFQNSAGAEIARSSYSCYSSTSTENFMNPIIGVNKIYILINGGGDWRNIQEFQAFESSCKGKMCGDDGCGGTCGSCDFGLTCNSGGQCIPSCTNECSLGAKRCNANNVETCGNYDTDVCSEWGITTSCLAGRTCNPSTFDCQLSLVSSSSPSSAILGSSYTVKCNFGVSNLGCIQVPSCTSAGFEGTNAIFSCTANPIGSKSNFCNLIASSEQGCFSKTNQITSTQVTCIPSCVGRICGDDGCGGSCGTCTNLHGTAGICSGGNCLAPTCTSGNDWGNCDNNNLNGCETNTITNNNCGTCGNICSLSEKCSNGDCECTLATCATLDKTCGVWDDGCGGILNCGAACSTACFSSNIAQGKSVTVSPAGSGSSLLITDGANSGMWDAGQAVNSNITINLGTDYNISRYSISCGGTDGGNTGIVYFQNSAGAEISHSHYSCYKNTVNESFLSPIIGVNKIYILINGGGDLANLGEFSAFTSGCPDGQSCDISVGRCLVIALSSSWSNMNDIPIISTNLSDTVKLVASGEVKDRVMNYTLKKESQLNWNPLSWFSSARVAQTSGKGFALWTTTETGGFYFIGQMLNVDGSVLKQVSSKEGSNGMGILNVYGYENSVPLIKIAKPAPESNYIINKSTGSTVPISFEQISYDEDDDLDIIWDFGDNSNAILSSCTTTGICNTTHSYTQSGTRLIRAVAQEMSRENKQSAIDNSRIFIYKEGLNIFAIIDSPNYNHIINEIGNYFIDGSSSHVANCSFESNKCRAGAQSKDCYTITDNSTLQKIYCYKFAVSDDKRFGFKWLIENKVDTSHVNFRYFNKSFVVPKDYPINLRVNFTF